MSQPGNEDSTPGPPETPGITESFDGGAASAAPTPGGQNNPDPERLSAALVEIEHYVAASGWDQASRLFALVPTAELMAAEPALADQLVVHNADQLSSVEQDGFHPGADLLAGLEEVAWPDTVAGAALTTERTFLPAGLEDEIPDDPDKAAEFVAAHPKHEEIRVVVGVMRDGTHYGVARLASNPDDLLAGDNLVPALSAALARTFHWMENEES